VKITGPNFFRYLTIAKEDHAANSYY